MGRASIIGSLRIQTLWDSKIFYQFLEYFGNRILNNELFYDLHVSIPVLKIGDQKINSTFFEEISSRLTLLSIFYFDIVILYLKCERKLWECCNVFLLLFLASISPHHQNLNLYFICICICAVFVFVFVLYLYLYLCREIVIRSPRSPRPHHLYFIHADIYFLHFIFGIFYIWYLQL